MNRSTLVLLAALGAFSPLLAAAETEVVRVQHRQCIPPGEPPPPIVTVQCPSGTAPTGGGFELDEGSTAEILASQPSPSGLGWGVTLGPDGGCVTVFAICVHGAAFLESQICPAGAGRLAEEGDCIACEPGKFNPDGIGDCEDCPAGMYGDAEGADGCQPCDVGKFTNAPGSTECSPCVPGTINDRDGAIACRTCEAGRYSADSGGLECAECEPGRFSNAGADDCFACSPGRFGSGCATPTPACNVCAQPTATAPPPATSTPPPTPTRTPACGTFQRRCSDGSCRFVCP